MMPGTTTFQLGYPLDEQRQHANFYMALNPSGCPMIHRRQLDLCALERTEASFYDHQAFVAAGGIFQADGVVIGFDNPM